MVSAWRVDDVSTAPNPVTPHQIGAFLSQRPEPNMSTDNLIEIARQADAIFGDQDDGIDGFETQMRRALAQPDPVGSDAIGVLMQDIEAAMFMCGHELIRSRDDAGNLALNRAALPGF